MKQEEAEANNEEKYKAIHCKYFPRNKGCRRGNKYWFNHDENHKKEKKNSTIKQNLTNNFKDEKNVVKNSKQEQGANLQPINIELLKILLRDSNI